MNSRSIVTFLAEVELGFAALAGLLLAASTKLAAPTLGWNFYLGVGLFLAGLAINRQADAVLRGLHRSGSSSWHDAGGQGERALPLLRPTKLVGMSTLAHASSDATKAVCHKQRPTNQNQRSRQSVSGRSPF